MQPATVALQREVAWLVDRRVEQHTTQLVIEYLQAAIEAAGGPLAGAASLPAIAFVDLAGLLNGWRGGRVVLSASGERQSDR